MYLFLFQGVFVYYIYSYEAVTLGEEYQYPKWAEIMGLCISFSSMIWVVLYAIYFMITTPGTLKERWMKGITPLFDQKKAETVALPEENRLFSNVEDMQEVNTTTNLA